MTKASGLAFLAEHLGFTAERTIAFGGENDVELLEWAGFGVAVANAHPRVLAVADWVCPSAEEEGVAQVMEASRLTRMIDIRAARAEPRPIAKRPARKGAVEDFDALMEADRAWLALVPQADELRAKTKLKGKPTPSRSRS